MKNIKKIIREIYKFDFSNNVLEDGDEILSRDKDYLDELIILLKKNDTANGIVVVPSGYNNGLFYKSSNNGEILNDPTWMPEIVSFNLNVYGLKKNHWYKLTTIGRSSGTNNIISSDRRILLKTPDGNLLQEHELKNVLDSNECKSSLFKADSNEMVINMTLGKVFLNNVILEEVELYEDIEKEDIADLVYSDNYKQLVAHGTFLLNPVKDKYSKRFIELIKTTGQGINLYYDKNTFEYILERDNTQELLTEPFTNTKYIIEVNTTKIPKYVKNTLMFDDFVTTEVSTDISRNTIKSGYVKFAFIKNNKIVDYRKDTNRLSVLVYKLGV